MFMSSKPVGGMWFLVECFLYFLFFFICYRMEMEMLAIDVDPQWQDKKKIYHIQM